MWHINKLGRDAERLDNLFFFILDRNGVYVFAGVQGGRASEIIQSCLDQGEKG